MKTSPDFLPQITLQSWQDFEKIIENHRYRDWVYRGQSNAEWEINSSLNRLLEDAKYLHIKANGRERKFNHLAHENLLIEKFMSHAHIYSRHLPEKTEKLEWLSIMQHFGAPTRLIDVTFSPYIALYFALESGTGDAAFYALQPKYYRSIDEKELDLEIQSSKIFNYEKSDDSFFVSYEPKHSNERLMAQQGLFLVPSKISQPFKNILGDYAHNKSKIFRIVIPASLKIDGLRMLRRMNISASVLFPGMDGFCKSLHSQVFNTTQQLRRMS